jgi:hypothetical protein
VAPPAPPPKSDLPQRLQEGQERHRRYALAALRNAVERVGSAPVGARNSTLNSETFALRRLSGDGPLTVHEIACAMTVAALRVGLDRSEIRNTLTSALRARVQP